jgi:lipopolysaccharide transport system ATP-binding protein
MSEIALKVENLSKQYRLGEVGTGTLSHDINRWWHKVRGKEDPYAIVGDTNDRTTQGDSEYVWSLKDINFEVKKGEILGIIGKNGAGKSTLLKLLSKVTGPTTGNIKMKGRVASLLEVGTGMHPELTGRENIYLNGAILGMTKAEVKKKLDEIVSFSGCAKYVDTPVKRYSSGMMVRLGFAVAAHLEPEILIVDEVLAVGDAEFQRKAIGKMKDVSQGGGRTVLFVSHNMDSIQKLCNSALLLDKGRLFKQGGIQEIISYYIQSNMSTSGSEVVFDKDIIKSACVLDQYNKASNTLFIGESFKIQIEVENFSMPTMQLGFFIKNSMDDRIATLTTEMIPIENIITKNNRKKITFNIKNPNIISGEYLIDIAVVSKQERMEFYENALKLELKYSDVYKTNFLLNNYFGKVFLDFDIKTEGYSKTEVI